MPVQQHTNVTLSKILLILIISVRYTIENIIYVFSRPITVYNVSTIVSTDNSFWKLILVMGQIKIAEGVLISYDACLKSQGCDLNMLPHRNWNFYLQKRLI